LKVFETPKLKINPSPKNSSFVLVLSRLVEKEGEREKKKRAKLFDFIKQSSLAIEICSQVPNISDVKQVDPRKRARADGNLGTTLPFLVLI